MKKILYYCLSLISLISYTQELKLTGWGSNTDGQLNIPSTLTGIRAVSAGGFHVLVLKRDGTVEAWGRNTNGQCDVPATLTGVKSIAAGVFHSLALKDDGTIVAWGAYGTGYVSVNNLIPSTLTGISDLSGGYDHSLFLFQDKTIRITGNGPGMGQFNAPSTLSGVIKIGTGHFQTLIINTDSTIGAWGEINNPLPYEVSTIPGVKLVDGGLGYSIALTSNGKITRWGGDDGGNLIVPIAFPEVKSIVAGANHVLGLTKNGKVQAFGNNTSNQTGVPITLSGVVSISAGDSYSIALYAPLSVSGILPAFAMADDVISITGALMEFTTVVGFKGIDGATVYVNPISVTSGLVLVKVPLDIENGNITISGLYGTVISDIPFNYQKNTQSITGFNAIALQNFKNNTFSIIGVNATSGLPVIFESSDLSVATISGSQIIFLQEGVTTITAIQPGGNNYEAAIPVSQILEIHKPAFFVSTKNIVGFKDQYFVSFTVSGTFLTDSVRFIVKSFDTDYWYNVPSPDTTQDFIDGCYFEEIINNLVLPTKNGRLYPTEIYIAFPALCAERLEEIRNMPFSGYVKITSLDVNEAVTINGVFLQNFSGGIKSIEIQPLSIYPNPVNDGYIQFNKTVSLTITDILGNPLKSYKNVTRINVDWLKKGVYFIKTTQGQYQKLLKE